MSASKFTETPNTKTRPTTPSSQERSDDGKVRDKKVTRRSKIHHHCSRFMWRYIILCIIFLAIFLPLLFKVIVPAIIEDILKKQKLPIKGGAVYLAYPDALTVSLESELSSPLPVSLGELTLALYKKETNGLFPFTHVQFAPQKVSKNTKLGIENQVCRVENQTELVKWLDDVFNNKEVDLSVRGRPALKLGALKYNPHVDKTITLPGLRKLEGFSLESLDLSFPPASKGITFQGKIMLPNWGALTIALGNVTFNVFLGDITVGELLLEKVLLPPGNTTLNCSGKLDWKAIMGNISEVLSSQSRALGSGQIELGVQSTKIVFNDKRIPYAESFLNNKRLVAPVPVFKLLTSALNGFTAGMGGSDEGALDRVGGVLGNQTFIQGLLDNWRPKSRVGKKSATAKKMLKYRYDV